MMLSKRRRCACIHMFLLKLLFSKLFLFFFFSFFFLFCLIIFCSTSIFFQISMLTTVFISCFGPNPHPAVGSGNSTSQLQERYRAGYLHCINEVRHFLLKEEGYTTVDQRLSRLMEHLHQRATMPSGQNHSVAAVTSSVSVGSDRPAVSLAFCTSPMSRTPAETPSRSAVTSPNHALNASSVMSPVSAAQSLQALSQTPQSQPSQQQQQQQQTAAVVATQAQQFPQPTGSPLVLSQILQPNQLQVTVLPSDIAQGLGQQSVQPAQQVLAHLGLAGSGADGSVQPGNV